MARTGLEPSGRVVLSPLACQWSHWCFVLAEPQKAAGIFPAVTRGPQKTLTLSQEVLSDPHNCSESPIHHHQYSCLHLWLGLAFLLTKGRGKGGKVTQTLRA